MSGREILTVKVIFVFLLILALALVLHLTAHNLTTQLGVTVATPAAGF